jgi:hypothetical protein
MSGTRNPADLVIKAQPPWSITSTLHTASLSPPRLGATAPHHDEEVATVVRSAHRQRQPSYAHHRRRMPPPHPKADPIFPTDGDSTTDTVLVTSASALTGGYYHRARDSRATMQIRLRSTQAAPRCGGQWCRQGHAGHRRGSGADFIASFNFASSFSPSSKSYHNDTLYSQTTDSRQPKKIFLLDRFMRVSRNKVWLEGSLWVRLQYLGQMAEEAISINSMPLASSRTKRVNQQPHV